MTTTLTPDLCVIGGGDVGLSIAVAAAGAGMSVTLVEKDEPGGRHLFEDIPALALIATARRAHESRQAAEVGLAPGDAGIDFGRIARRLQAVREALVPERSMERMTALGIRMVTAAARFTDRRTLVADGFAIRARRFVIATGTRPADPGIDGLEAVEHMTPRTLAALTRKPRHLVVVGAGRTGLALAQAFGRLGCAVTVIDAGRALSGEDEEVAGILLAQLRREGVTVLEDRRAVSVVRHGRAGLRVVTATLDGEGAFHEGTHLLLATGRRPDLDALGLDAAGIAFGADGIKVGKGLATSNKRILAAGDVTKDGRAGDVASHHCTLLARALLARRTDTPRPALAPRVTPTDPAIAHVGLTEAEARATHLRPTVLRSPFAGNAWARARQRPEGLFKLVADGRGRILGVSIVGAGAGELISVWALAIARGMTIDEMAAHTPAGGTLSQIGQEAALSYLSGSIDMRPGRFSRLLGRSR